LLLCNFLGKPPCDSTKNKASLQSSSHLAIVS
jgi:hypothetical protein